MNEDIGTRILSVKTSIRDICGESNRLPNSVKLVAVSKGQNISQLLSAISAGQNCFGENYLQEALEKIKALENKNLEWHFLGPIQSNKTKVIAENFSWVHGLCRIKIAEKLNRYRPKYLAPINVCVQINIDNESGKAGLALDQALDFFNQTKFYSQLKIRGLMIIPRKLTSPSQSIMRFNTLKNKLEEINNHGFQLDTLSMGMTQDFRQAIRSGATIVRIGKAIFGER